MAGSKENSILVVILDMYGIELTLSSIAGAREPSVLAIVPYMHGTVIEYM